MLSSPVKPAIVNIHASCVVVAGHGILILGGSGQGKSDLALRLVDRGAQLVADDRCDLWAEDGQLWCAPPERLAGRIEVRGIGIVEKPWTAPAPVRLAVRLSDRYERMPSGNCVEMIADHPLPAVILSAFEVSAPIKVRLALERITAASALP